MSGPRFNSAASLSAPEPTKVRVRVQNEAMSLTRFAAFLKPVTAMLAVAFFVAGIYGAIVGRSEPLMERLAVANAFVFLMVRLVLGYFSWPKRNPHVTASVGVAFITTYALMSMWANGALWATAYLAMTILFMGFLFVSRVWFYIDALVICASWTWLAFSQVDSPGWSSMAGALVSSFFFAAFQLEMRRKIAVSEGKRAAEAAVQENAVSKLNSEETPRWCPVCKTSPDAIVRHDGEMIVDANASAAALFSVSSFEMAKLPVVGLFHPEKREELKPILRRGDFEPFEAIASGFQEEHLPVKVLNGGETSGELRTLVIRDLRDVEKLRQQATGANRRSQQSVVRNRELAGAARKQSRQTLEDKLKALTQTVHRWLPCTVGCSVILWDNVAQSFRAAASSAAGPLKLDALLAEDAPSIVTYLSEYGEALVIPKVGDDKFCVRKLYSSEPVNAYAALPLMTQDGMMGFFLVLERNHREFAPDELDYLTIVAQLATNASDRAMLEEQLNNTHEHNG